MTRVEDPARARGAASGSRRCVFQPGDEVEALVELARAGAGSRPGRPAGRRRSSRSRRPAAWANPAASAAALPKLRRSRTTTTFVAGGVQPRQRGVGAVGGAVVDEDRLPRGAERLQRRVELVEEQRDAPLLVVHGDDDGDHAREPTPAARRRRRRARVGRGRRWSRSSSTAALVVAAVVAGGDASLVVAAVAAVEVGGVTRRLGGRHGRGRRRAQVVVGPVVVAAVAAGLSWSCAEGSPAAGRVALVSSRSSSEPSSTATAGAAEPPSCR